MKNIGKDLTGQLTFHLPTKRPTRSLTCYESRWLESEAAYLIRERSQIAPSQSSVFPFEQAQKSLDDFLATQATHKKQTAEMAEQRGRSHSESTVNSSNLGVEDGFITDPQTPDTNTSDEEEAGEEWEEEVDILSDNDSLSEGEETTVKLSDQDQDHIPDVEAGSIIETTKPTVDAPQGCEDMIPSLTSDSIDTLEFLSKGQLTQTANERVCELFDQKEASQEMSQGQEDCGNSPGLFANAHESETPCLDAAQFLADARELAKEAGIMKLTLLTCGKSESLDVRSFDGGVAKRNGSFAKPFKTIEHRKEEWYSPVINILDNLAGAAMGYVNPFCALLYPSVPHSVHHLNYNFNAVPTKSATPPEVSLWAIASIQNKHHVHQPQFSRQSILTAEAMRFVDPVYYDGPPDSLWLTGSELREAVTGQAYKCYAPVGSWGSDCYGAEENVPFAAHPQAMYWNCMNGPPVPQPHIFFEEDGLMPNINVDGNYLWPSRPDDSRVRRPSPLRQMSSSVPSSDIPEEADQTGAMMPVEDVPELVCSSGSSEESFDSSNDDLPRKISEDLRCSPTSVVERSSEVDTDPICEAQLGLSAEEVEDADDAVDGENFGEQKKGVAEGMATSSEPAEKIGDTSSWNGRKQNEGIREIQDKSSLEGSEPLPVGKWICYGAAVAYIGFCVFQRLRR